MAQDTHETKLQRHARRFRECSDQGAVLHRYATKIEAADKPELLKYMSHACGWVALPQPPPDAAVRRGQQHLSPVLVLSKMLRLRGRRRLDDRARAALEAVASCCNLVLGDGSCDNKQDWTELKRALPAFSKKRKPDDYSGGSSASSDIQVEDAFVFKRVRRLNESICAWRNHDAVADQTHATSLKEQFQQTLQDGDVDSVRLRKLLYKVAGALSSPRLAPTFSNEPAPLDEMAAERLRAAATFQKWMRSMFATGIKMWRETLYLEDLQIAPILNHVRTLIHEYEKTHVDVRQACAGKQWHELKILVGLAETQDKQRQELNEQVSGPIKKQKKKQTVFTPSSGAKLKDAALMAFRRLGNEATAAELLEKITSDEDIWSLIADNINMQPSKSSLRMKNRTLEVWEANVMNNFPARHCISTGAKRDGLTVYKLRLAV